MASLIPYAAQELAKPQNAALAVDIFAEAGKAAHGMYSSYKKRGKRKRRKTQEVGADIGRPANYNESRRRDRQQGVTVWSNKTMQTEALIDVEKNVAGDEAIQKRNRDTIHHKGSKICFSVKNILKVPVMFNWAVVVPKANNTVSPIDILRGNGAERDVTLNNALTFMDLRCLPINTDRYRVVKHKKMLIQPDSDKGADQSEGRDFRLIEEYIKTNRQLFFDGSSAKPLQNMWMVWWCDYYNSPTGSTAATIQYSWRIVDYFNDVP